MKNTKDALLIRFPSNPTAVKDECIFDEQPVNLVLPGVVKILRLIDSYLARTLQGQEIRNKASYRCNPTKQYTQLIKKLQRDVIFIYISKIFGPVYLIKEKLENCINQISKNDPLYSMLLGLSIYLKNPGSYIKYWEKEKLFPNIHITQNQMEIILDIKQNTPEGDEAYFIRHVIQHTLSIFTKDSRSIVKKFFAQSPQVKTECDKIIKVLDELSNLTSKELIAKTRISHVGLKHASKINIADYLLSEIHENLHHGPTIPVALINSKPFMSTVRRAHKFLSLLKNDENTNLNEEFESFIAPWYEFNTIPSSQSFCLCCLGKKLDKQHEAHSEELGLTVSPSSSTVYSSSPSSAFRETVSTSQREVPEIPQFAMNNNTLKEGLARLLRVFDYYSNTKAGRQIVQNLNQQANVSVSLNNNRSKQKWQSMLTKECINLVRQYHKNILTLETFTSTIDKLANQINNSFCGKKSRLAKSLYQLTNHYKTDKKIIPADLPSLPKEILDLDNQYFNKEKINSYLQSQKLFVKSNSTLIANLLRILDYYLDNEIGRILNRKINFADNEKVVRINSMPRFKKEAEELIKFIMEAKQTTISRKKILQNIDEFYNKICSSRFISHNSKRLAESLAYVSYQYGGSSKPSSNKTTFPKGFYNIIDLSMSEFVAEGYILHYEELKKPLHKDNNDEINYALKLIGILLRMDAYYQNTPFGQALVNAANKSGNRFRIIPNPKTKWIKQMQELARFALQMYHEKPIFTQERIITKMKSTILEIRSHNFTGGNNSELATTLERLVSHFTYDKKFTPFNNTVEDSIDEFNKIVTLPAEILTYNSEFDSKFTISNQEAEDILLCTVLDKTMSIWQKYQNAVTARYRNTSSIKQETVIKIIKDLNKIYHAKSFEQRKYRIMASINAETHSEYQDILAGKSDPCVKALYIASSVDIRRFIEKVICVHTHKEGAFNAKFAEGDFGNALKEMTAYLDSIAPLKTPTAVEIIYNKTCS